MNVVVTWMYCSPPKEKINHAQMGADSDLAETQNYYWRCIFLMFESSWRLNGGDTRHILLVNKRPPDEIDGVDTRQLIEQYGVEVIDIPNITKAPEDYHTAWNIQFTLIDIMKWIGENTAAEDHVYLLDSDVVFNLPLNDEMAEVIDKKKAMIYTIDYELDHVVNGNTRRDLLAISKEMSGGYDRDEFRYAGGEIIGGLGKEYTRMAELSRKYYEECLERYANKQSKFLTEEHLFSYVYDLLGYEPYTANKFLKRIWTDRSLYTTITGDEHGLVFWHLPAEKKKGFYKLFQQYRLKDDGSYVLDTDQHGRFYGIDATLGTHLMVWPKRVARKMYYMLKK
ncbi:hypothetical protein KS4_22720 [Poriferisphaera corsica]|uniref:Uncharacterized protein n=1 Tax=Poriferisphaera corsica TaxID=2528020 RepID=A0A517YVF9_9BACT|nr:hypothetical protein [Poriferisphaera corsica]QDU34207.1 hypothetical protein KS4_22720 [Poriferisphaera corsica]